MMLFVSEDSKLLFNYITKKISIKKWDFFVTVKNKIIIPEQRLLVVLNICELTQNITPLYYAASIGNIKAVDFLSSIVGINLGETTHAAVTSDCCLDDILCMVEILKSVGTNLWLHNKNNETPIMCLIKRINDEKPSCHKYVESINRIMDSFGKPPIHL